MTDVQPHTAQPAAAQPVAHAGMQNARPGTPPSGAPQQQQPPQRGARAWRALRTALPALALTVAAALAGAWWWAGSEGSAATALRWARQSPLAAALQGLNSEGVGGSLRHGMQVQHLVWQQDGLRVQADNARLRWNAVRLLLGRTLHVQSLSADRIRIEQLPRTTPASAPSAPPQSAALPLRVLLDELRVGELQWLPAPAPDGSRADAQSVRGIHGQYAWDGQNHTVQLHSAQWQNGTLHARTQARAQLGGHAPLTLQLAAAAAINAHGLPGAAQNGAAASLPLLAQATLQGPLTDLQARLRINGAAIGNATAAASTASQPASAADSALPLPPPPLPVMGDALDADAPPAANTQAASPSAADANTANAHAAPTGGHTANAPPQAHAQARITPWADQPVPEAHLHLLNFNAADVLAQAPRTRLAGALHAQPTPASGSSAAGWAVQADIANALPGPWDQGQLPVSRLVADVLWQGGAADVRALKAHMGDGLLQAQGRWAAPQNTPQQWRLDAQLHAINPALLHSQLAPLLVDGTASAESTPQSGQASTAADSMAADFGIELKARAGHAQTAPAANAGAAGQALLQLRQASAHGRWAGGSLALQELLVRTADAELAGSATVRLQAAHAHGQAPQQPATANAHLGGQADLRLSLPGANAHIKGELHHTRGQGTLQAQVQNAAQTLDWARRLPGAQDALAGVHASGAASLHGGWRGGWADPAVQAQLQVPALDMRLPASAASTASAATEAAAPEATAQTTAAQNLQLRQVQADINGGIHHMQLRLNGQAAQTLTSTPPTPAQATAKTTPAGTRQIRLQLAASGGRSRAGATPAASDWRARITELAAEVADPALGRDAWRVALRGGEVPVEWAGTQGQRLQVGAGEATVAPAAPNASAATLAWQPLRWQGGHLDTAGRISGLPLAWAERIGGRALADSGVQGTLVLDGAWDAHLGQTLRLNAHLARASGDLSVLATNGDTGARQRIAAGLRQARIDIQGQGREVRAQAQWDSEHAGSVQAHVGTRLAGDGVGALQAGLPPDAPLQGHIKASLPQIAAWSVLAPTGWRMRGALAADVAVAGTIGQPQLRGALTADDLALRSVVDGLQFQDGRLRARLEGTRLLVDEFTLRGAAPRTTSGASSGAASGAASGASGNAAAAGGLIRASGEAGWIDGRAQARLNASIEQLRASIREDRQITASGQLSAALDGRALQVSGRIKADRAHIELPDDSAPSLGDDVTVHAADGRSASGANAPAELATPVKAAKAATAPTSAASRPSAQAAAQPPLTVKADVQLDLGDAFRLRGQGIDTRLAGTLSLTANGAAGTLPRLRGTVRTVGGTFRAYGQLLNIERGNIIFEGDAANPTLDILALRPNYSSDQRVGALVQGTALLPHVRLYSSPALSESETLAWLILGRAAPSTGAEAAMLQSAALAVLGGRGGKGLASRFGLDELSLGGADSSGLSNASVTMGKRLSDKLYAAYEYSLAGATGTLMVFYELSQRWTLRGQAGLDSAIDLIYRLSFD